LIQPDGAISLIAGSGSRAVSGTDDAINGSGARFENPRGIYWAGGNLGLLVSDTGNHTVRRLFFNPAVSAYSVETFAGSAGSAGFVNGPAGVARFDGPVGITRDLVTRNFLVVDGGNQALRRIQVASVTNPPVIIEPPITVAPPTIEPAYGYFPTGRSIQVNSATPNVYYTTDGTEPTTNSLRVEITNDTGFISWRESLLDLSSLRVRAFIGTNASLVTAGKQAPVNEIGIPRDLVAGIGAVAVVPVVVNLATNAELRTVQFRVEVTPDGDGPVVSDQMRALAVTGSEFVPVLAPGTNAVLSVLPYLNGTSRGIAISAIGSQANFLVDRIAVVVNLAVPIPPSATEGQTYSIHVLEPSGTSDAQQIPTTLTASAPRVITVRNLSYTVGDTAPGGWYNAGDFGNGSLSNNDVNNAFYAALGTRLPYTFSDAFDAMDAFPVDSAVSVGGDGEIRFLDWQRILRRSLRLETANWNRAWSPGGFRVARAAGLGLSMGNAGRVSPPPPALWNPQALIGAGSLPNVVPGQPVAVPVYAKVAAGAKLSGLLFSAVVTADGDSPALPEPVKFTLAPGIPGGTPASLDARTVGYGWNIGAFTPALQQSNVLGFIEFATPVLARSGHSYSIRFTKVDGSPDFDTQYDLESAPGRVVVAAPVPAGHFVSAEWQRHYFGATPGESAGADADPDGDGATNWAEYTAGTSPVDAGSGLRLVVEQNSGGVFLRWQAAPGRSYVVERLSTLDQSGWTTAGSVAAGAGGEQVFTDGNPPAGTAFYRVRVVTP
jgi:hypothetical protein